MLPLVNSPWVGATSFALGAIFLAMIVYVVLRLVLGPHISQDTATLSSSIITRLGALHSLILALMFAQEMQAYLNLSTLLTKEATALANVYYKLDYFDQDDPESTAKIRRKIREYLETHLDKEQRFLAVETMSRELWKRYGAIEQGILELPSEKTNLRELRSDIRKDWNTIPEYRRSYHDASARKIPTFFWALTILGFVFIVIPFHAFKPKLSNLTAIAVFAAFNGIVIYFIYAMNNPFTGATPIEPVAIEQLYLEVISGYTGK